MDPELIPPPTYHDPALPDPPEKLPDPLPFVPEVFDPPTYDPPAKPAPPPFKPPPPLPPQEAAPTFRAPTPTPPPPKPKDPTLTLPKPPVDPPPLPEPEPPDPGPPPTPLPDPTYVPPALPAAPEAWAPPDPGPEPAAFDEPDEPLPVLDLDVKVRFVPVHDGDGESVGLVVLPPYAQPDPPPPPSPGEEATEEVTPEATPPPTPPPETYQRSPGPRPVYAAPALEPIVVPAVEPVFVPPRVEDAGYPRWVEPLPPRVSQRPLPGNSPVVVLDVSGTMADQVSEARGCVRELLHPAIGALAMNKRGFDVIAFAHAAVSAGEDLEGRARRLASALSEGERAGPSGSGRETGYDLLEARAAAAARGESFPLLEPPPLPRDRARRLIPARAWALAAVREWCDELLNRGRTDMLAALHAAHEYPAADGVYLVSDGLPDDPKAILRAVEAAGTPEGFGHGRVAGALSPGGPPALLPVHAIGIRPDGRGERFLRRLAEATGGTYARFDDDEALLEMVARDTIAPGGGGIGGLNVNVPGVFAMTTMEGEEDGSPTDDLDDDDDEEVVSVEEDAFLGDRRGDAGAVDLSDDRVVPRPPLFRLTGGDLDSAGEGVEAAGQTPTDAPKKKPKTRRLRTKTKRGAHRAKPKAPSVAPSTAGNGILVGDGAVVVAGVRGGGAGARSVRANVVGDGGDGGTVSLGIASPSVGGGAGVGASVAAAAVVLAAARRRRPVARRDLRAVLRERDPDLEWAEATFQKEADALAARLEAEDASRDVEAGEDLDLDPMAGWNEAAARTKAAHAARCAEVAAAAEEANAAARFEAEARYAEQLAAFDAAYGPGSPWRTAFEAEEAAAVAAAKAEHARAMWRWAAAIAADRAVAERRADAIAAAFRAARARFISAREKKMEKIEAATRRRLVGDLTAAALHNVVERARVGAINGEAMARILAEHEAATREVHQRNAYRAVRREGARTARERWAAERDAGVVSTLAAWAVASGAHRAEAWHAVRDALDAHAAAVRGVHEANGAAREAHEAALEARRAYVKLAEERQREMAAAADAHRAATREAEVAWERERALLFEAWNAEVDEVNEANRRALEEARAAFDADETVREKARIAAEKQREAMEAAMNAYRASIERAEELHRWRLGRYNLSHRRETLKRRVYHRRRQFLAAAAHRAATKKLLEEREKTFDRWEAACEASRSEAREAFRRETEATEAANASTLARARAAHDAAVAAAEAHNLEWTPSVERRRRALAELERVRAFNDAVVAAAVAVPSGARRVVETSTLQTALTRGFAAPPLPESMDPARGGDEDAPVPFFHPALLSAAIKKHAAAGRARQAAGGRRLSPVPPTHPGPANPAGGAGGSPANESRGALRNPKEGTKGAPSPAAVFFKTYPATAGQRPASASPELPAVRGAVFHPFPAQTNKPEELASEEDVCAPCPGEGAHGGHHAVTSSAYDFFATGGGLPGGRASPTLRGGRLYTPEPRRLRGEMETPWRRLRPSTARPRLGRSSPPARGGHRSRGDADEDDAKAKEEAEEEDWGELIPTGGGDAFEGRSGVSTPWDAVPGPPMPSPPPRVDRLAGDDDAARSTSPSPRLFRPWSARVAKLKGDEFSQAARGSDADRPGSARPATKTKTKTERETERGGGDVGSGPPAKPVMSNVGIHSAAAEGAGTMIAAALGLPRTRRRGDNDVEDDMDDDVDDVVDPALTGGTETRGGPWRPRPVSASLLLPRRCHSPSRPVSASPATAGEDRVTTRVTTVGPPSAAAETDTRAATVSDAPPLCGSGGYAWQGGAPGQWRDEVSRAEGVLRRPRGEPARRPQTWSPAMMDPASFAPPPRGDAAESASPPSQRRRPSTATSKRSAQSADGSASARPRGGVRLTPAASTPPMRSPALPTPVVGGMAAPRRRALDGLAHAAAAAAAAMDAEVRLVNEAAALVAERSGGGIAGILQKTTQDGRTSGMSSPASSGVAPLKSTGGSAASRVAAFEAARAGGLRPARGWSPGTGRGVTRGHGGGAAGTATWRPGRDVAGSASGPRATPGSDVTVFVSQAGVTQAVTVTSEKKYRVAAPGGALNPTRIRQRGLGRSPSGSRRWG